MHRVLAILGLLISFLVFIPLVPIIGILIGIYILYKDEEIGVRNIAKAAIFIGIIACSYQLITIDNNKIVMDQDIREQLLESKERITLMQTELTMSPRGVFIPLAIRNNLAYDSQFRIKESVRCDTSHITFETYPDRTIAADTSEAIPLMARPMPELIQGKYNCRIELYTGRELYESKSFQLTFEK